MSDAPQIETTFRPETVNEVLLLNRIRELQIASYEKGLSPLRKPWLPQDISVHHAPPITLKLAASVESEWKEYEGIKVFARSRGEGKASLGCHYYVSEETLHAMAPSTAANMLGDLHQRLIRDLAGIVARGAAVMGPGL